MPRRESGFSQPLIILGVVAAAGLLLYFSANSNKNSQKIQEETPREIQEQTKEEIKDVPNPVNRFLKTNDIEKYEKAGMKIYKGNNPPNIEGSYYFNGLVLFYEEPWDKQGNIGDEVDNYNYKFYDQKSDGTINSSYIAESVPSEADGIGSFISGNDNCFTIFIDDKGKGFSCNTRESRVISACKTDKGLEQIKDGFIMKEKEGPDCEELLPVGNLRIITEDDSLAEQIDE